MNAARASFSPPPKPAHLRPYPAPSTANTHNPVSPHNGGGDHEATRGGRPQRLSPQEAALRGASLAFQKQKEQSMGAANSDNYNNHNNNARVSRQTTGSSTVSAWEAVEQRERERERQALFLSPSSASFATTRDAHMGHGVAAPQIGRETDGTTATAPPPSARMSASFIAATLAVSRSNTPVHSDTATAAAGDGGSGNGGGIGGGMSRVSTLREPAEAQRRVRGQRGSSGVTSPMHSSEDLTDTTSLAPAISLISMFEHKGDAEKMEPQKRASRPGSPEKPRPRSAYAVVHRDGGGDDYVAQEIGSPSTTNRPKPSLKPKPKPRTKTQVGEQTPSPPLVRRASPSIVSPKPRRPDTLPRWESPAKYDEDIESNNVTPKATIKPKQAPKVPNPRGTASRRDEGRLEKPLHTMAEENRKVEQQPPKLPDRIPPAHSKERPPAPRKSAELSRRVSLSPRVEDPRIHDVAHTDGQQESTLIATERIPDARPSTADSKSSNDSFVSASSVPTRDGTDSLHTVGRSTPSSTTPRPVISRPRSAQPPLVAPPIRQSVTGSSQLPLDSLSDAIVAGSLASARHTPVSAAEGRVLPPAPPPRRQAQRRMKHTLRQPKALSDDEDARRPHHRKGLNNKKHAHHEGSRRRWREEITERERKRYEAVWASNRGLFLVQTQQQHQQQQSQTSSSLDVNQRPQLATQQNRGQPVRNESYEELSECVANVVVRDIWTRSRLPPAELAEVWDLVYGYGRTPVHATLSKQEFVVGMWLIDQRLRGRKIPPRVSESVWGSAKGVRVLSPGKAEKHHHHYHPHRPGHNKFKGK